MRTFALLLLAFFANAAVSEDGQTFDRQFEQIRSDRRVLHAFFRDMPLGGDIHTHLSGAVSVDTTIQIASRHHYYFAFSRDDEFTGFVAPEITVEQGAVTRSTRGRCDDGDTCLQAAELSNVHREAIRQAIWINEKDAERGEGGRFSDFVRVFSMLDELTDNADVIPEFIHALMDEAAELHVSYLELKITPYNRRNSMGDVVSIEELLENLGREIDAKNGSLARAGKRSVVVKLVAQLLRSRPLRTGGITGLPYITCFGDDCPSRWEQAHYLATLSRYSDFVVGYDFVGLPEVKIEVPGSSARQFIEELTDRYGDANIAIHSGESTQGDLADNIELALDAGADRLGHAYNLGSLVSDETLRLVCQGGIPMVIGLSSNVRLQVAETIDQHPYVSFIRGDICPNNRPLPVALATDDAGLFNTDLSLEFCIAAANSDLTWNEMKRIAKQSLQASFASGDEKAQLISQWERDIQRFESTWTPPTSTTDLPTGCPDPI